MIDNSTSTVQTFTPPFAMGQWVHHIWHGRKKVTLPCPFCGATGDIKGADGTLYTCPKCGGQRIKIEWRAKAWQDQGVFTIGRIAFEWTGAYVNGGEIASNYGSQVEKMRWTFMCYETGIGSGQNYDADNLFATAEEAAIACGIRNAYEVVK